MKLKKIASDSVVYGAVILTATNLTSQVVGFVYRVFLSRMIDTETMGLFQLVMPIYSVFSSLAISGLAVAVSRLTASYGAQGRTRAVGQLMRTALILFGGIFLLLAVPTILFSDAISVHLLGDARTRLGLLWLLPCILFTGVENIHKNYFYGQRTVNQPAVTEIVEQVTRTTAVLSLLYILHPYYEEYAVGVIVAGMTICEVVSAGMLRLFYQRKTRHLPCQGPVEPRRDIVRAIGRIAVPIATANVVSALLGAAGSVLIPARLTASGLTATEALSSFGVVSGMTLPLLGLPSAFVIALSLVMVPRLSASTALGKSVTGQVESAISYTAKLLLPAITLLMLLGKPIAGALFNHEEAGQYMVPLAIATLFGSFQHILGSVLSGMGHQGRTARNYILSGVVQLVLTYALVGLPELRMLGFVIAYLAADVFGAAICLWDVRRLSGVRLRWGRWFLPPLVGCLLMGVVAWCLFGFLQAETAWPLWQSALVCIPPAAALYLCVLKGIKT